MIQTKRETPKEEVPKSLEQIVAEQAQQIIDMQKAIDDLILNGGAV